MGKHFSLTASDKHQLGAYRADPKAGARGAVVVIQEKGSRRGDLLLRRADRRLRRGEAALSDADAFRR